jgi:VCBS repeat protein
MIKECPDMLPMSTVTRPFLAILALLTLTAPCLAFVGPQYTFGRHDFQTGTFPSGVVAADVNGDGKEDVIVANQLDNTVSVFLGQPNGIFGARQNFPTAAGPVALVVADFNHDGKLDLAVVASSANVVSVLLGNGNGTFRPAVNYPTGQGPYALAAGDFNHDGNVDLAVVDSCGPNSCSNTVSILLAKADGTFQSKKDYPVGATPIAIAAHDLNGDGNLDLAVANSGGNSISILLGNANGTFKPSIEAATEAAPCGIAIADFDGDKIPDLAVTHQNAPWALTVLKGNGNGTFQTEQQVAQLVDTNEVVAVDVNRDGKTDLVLTVVSQGGALIFIGKGDGTFQSPVNYTTGTYAYGLAVQDVNGDGNRDLVVTDQESHYLTVLLGNGDGTFGPRTTLPSASNNPLDQGSQASVIGDFNGDGVPDLVMADYTGVLLFLGAGKGKFGKPIAVDSYQANAVVAGDFNGDGRLDLALATSKVEVLLGNGNGTFTQSAELTLASPVRGAFVVGDFNNDGYQDLVVVGNGFLQPNPIYLFLGRGDGTFQTPKQFWSSSSIPFAIASGDFNHDGRLDLVVMLGGTGIAVLLGNGDGTFQSPVSYSTDLPPNGLAVADVNGDGILDILATGDLLDVFLGKGDGTFAQRIDYPAGNFPGSVTTGDFNGDGILDVAVAAEGSGAMGNLEIMLGTGGGKFAAPVEVASPGADFFPLTAGDLNQDGTTDLVTAGAGGGSLFLSGPVATVSPTILDFGAIKVGNTSTPRTITLVNTGNASLKVNTVTATSGYKVIADTCGSPVKQRSFCSFKIEFIPVVSGAYIGILSIGDNAPRGKQTVTLLGKGTP